MFPSPRMMFLLSRPGRTITDNPPDMGSRHKDVIHGDTNRQNMQTQGTLILVRRRPCLLFLPQTGSRYQFLRKQGSLWHITSMMGAADST